MNNLLAIRKQQGVFLRSLRLKKGYSIAQVAQTLGINANSLSQIETGRLPGSENTWAKLEAFYHLPVGSLRDTRFHSNTLPDVAPALDPAENAQLALDFKDTPLHYKSTMGNFDVLDFIDAYNLNFNLGNVVKYVARAGKKSGEDKLTALKKALVYLEHEIILAERK